MTIRRTISMLTLFVACWGGLARGANTDKLNVIFFLMDDLGWNDLGFTGSKFFESPNIDRLSQRGVVFTRAYAACICSPSRASIITGLDPARTGLTMPRGGDPLEVLKAHVQPRIYTPAELKDNWRNLPGGMQSPPNQRAMSVVSASRLSTEYRSIAKVFKAAGYRTAHFGKWHVGPEPFSPIEHGFDIDVPHVNSAGPMGRHFGPWREWVEESGPESKGRQIDDVLADHAVKFIQENKDRPFYMNFWTYGVHVPIQAREETIAYFKAKAPKTGQNNPVYAAMIKHTDDAIGRVWKAVEEAVLAQKTVIVFYSDNGGVNYGTPQITDNSPLRGGKGNIYEGGVRVPAFFVWPGVAQAGTTCDLPINTRDFFPTLAEICGVGGLPKFDGRSVAPALSGKPMEAKPIFTHYPHYTGNWGNGGAPATTVVSEGWKLFRVYYDGPAQTDRFELYNLKDDPGETLDYHRSKPELVAKLNNLIEAFVKETGAALPKPNPDYKGALKGEFEGLSYKLLEPVVKRGARWPLVVCLEGEGNPAYVELHKTSIQNRNGTFLLAVKSHEKVADLIAKLLKDYPIQPRQVYVTGQGIGAVAAWELAARHPGLFAAVLPVGGAGVPEQVAALKDVSVWAFHGAHDAVMPVAGARKMNDALKAAGSTVAKSTEYSQNEQVLLDNVWGNPEVLEWLFGQTRK
jgi:arylsulfatase A-like enzyme